MTGGQRGTTTIADRVVEKLVTYAVRDNDATGDIERTVLGLPLGGRRPANVDVSIHGESVAVRVEMSVSYPEPVRDTARTVRERVRHEVERTTGLRVSQVDVEVSSFDRSVPAQRRELAGVR
ncbi:Asp23/Gls24 family envelope stress response protein [Actinomadura flavalba]|uniref:Asp23/Gls24 family envelope stress response protein n=1 Tax=Actinomadura flavalba TaxID=1120938 RepID=UPI00037F0694|nr:Asp23/Gls24 family envelope stress response protein [Actinomadura flavalba]